MTNNLKGGRGKVAPYTSTHCRIPEPIKPTVERFAAAYRSLVVAEDKNGYENLIRATDEAISNLGEAEQEIKDLKAELLEAKNKAEKLESEKQFAIDNLLTTYKLHSREGVKMKEIIVTAIPEIRNYPEFLAWDKRRAKK
jgi:hypothetical protein